MPEDEFDVGRLTAADVAARKFEKVRRGFDPPSVRAYLIEVSHELERLAGEVAAVNARADKLSQLDEAAVTAALGEEAAAVLHTARESAAAIEARAQAQAAQLVADAEEAANDIQARLDQERERAYAEGVAKAEETAGATLDEARGEARRLLDEAKAARNKVLGDLARRRKAARTQLEQLVAARDRLLAAFGVVRTSIDKATDELRVSLPEARAAADIAVRRAQSEPDDTVETLEHEIETLKLAGLMLVPDADDDDTESGEAAGPQPWTFQVRRDPPPEPELHQVDAAAPFEEVRVLPAHQEADGEVQPDAGTDVEVVVPAWPVAEPEPALEGEPEAEPEGEPLEAADEGEPEQVAEPEPPAPAEVDALFARLRAGREDKVAAARQVLEATSAHPVGVPDDATMLARRAEALTPVIASMTKRLKRLLADEQNEVLDLLRRHEGSSADGVVPDPDAHRDRWSAAVTDDLATAHAAGSGTAEASADVAAVAAELAAAVCDPLRGRLHAVLDGADDDADAAADGIRAAYREWRSRLPDVGEHHAAAAYGLGVYDAAPDGARLRWLVDDGGSPCPDCDDNALAGAVVKGEPYPTGQVVPPAHAGCRCLLVPAG